MRRNKTFQFLLSLILCVGVFIFLLIGNGGTNRCSGQDNFDGLLPPADVPVQPNNPNNSSNSNRPNSSDNASNPGRPNGGNPGAGTEFGTAGDMFSNSQNQSRQGQTQGQARSDENFNSQNSAGQNQAGQNSAGQNPPGANSSDRANGGNTAQEPTKPNPEQRENVASSHPMFKLLDPPNAGYSVIKGEQLSLQTLVTSSSLSGRQRLERVCAYWTLVEKMSVHMLTVNRELDLKFCVKTYLSKNAAPTGGEQSFIKSEENQATLDRKKAEIAFIQEQYRFVSRFRKDVPLPLLKEGETSNRSTVSNDVNQSALQKIAREIDRLQNVLPLPTTYPAISPYDAKIVSQTQFRRLSANAQTLYRLLPLKYETVQTRQLEANLAQQYLHAVFGAENTSILQLLTAVDNSMTAQKNMIRAIIDYNQTIAFYVAETVPEQISGMTYLSTLIYLPQVSHSLNPEQQNERPSATTFLNEGQNRRPQETFLTSLMKNETSDSGDKIVLDKVNRWNEIEFLSEISDLDNNKVSNEIDVFEKNSNIDRNRGEFSSNENIVFADVSAVVDMSAEMSERKNDESGVQRVFRPDFSTNFSQNSFQNRQRQNRISLSAWDFYTNPQDSLDSENLLYHSYPDNLKDVLKDSRNEVSSAPVSVYRPVQLGFKPVLEISRDEQPVIRGQRPTSDSSNSESIGLGTAVPNNSAPTNSAPNNSAPNNSAPGNVSEMTENADLLQPVTASEIPGAEAAGMPSNPNDGFSSAADTSGSDGLIPLDSDFSADGSSTNPLPAQTSGNAGTEKTEIGAAGTGTQSNRPLSPKGQLSGIMDIFFPVLERIELPVSQSNSMYQQAQLLEQPKEFPFSLENALNESPGDNAHRLEIVSAYWALRRSQAVFQTEQLVQNACRTMLEGLQKQNVQTVPQGSSTIGWFKTMLATQTARVSEAFVQVRKAQLALLRVLNRGIENGLPIAVSVPCYKNYNLSLENADPQQIYNLDFQEQVLLIPTMLYLITEQGNQLGKGADIFACSFAIQSFDDIYLYAKYLESQRAQVLQLLELVESLNISIAKYISVYSPIFLPTPTYIRCLVPSEE